MALNDTERSRLEAACAHRMAPAIPRANVLRYSVVRQVLWGSVAGQSYGPVAGVSGAGQDGVHRRAVSLSEWTPSRKAQSRAKDGRGGAIVPGWWIVLPEELGKGEGSSWLPWGAAPTAHSLRVVPYALDASYAQGQRHSFYLHGTGGAGSDGCILLPPTHRQVLVNRVLEGGGAWLHAFVSGIELNDAVDHSIAVRSIA